MEDLGSELALLQISCVVTSADKNTHTALAGNSCFLQHGQGQATPEESPLCHHLEMSNGTIQNYKG